MSNLRFEVGTFVMCNLGPSGWKLGRIIALNYREDHWPAGKHVSYQVVLEQDGKFIYVPEDDVLYCREATQEDLRIALRMDALPIRFSQCERAMRTVAGRGSPAKTFRLV